jgi:hypothetical protein
MKFACLLPLVLMFIPWPVLGEGRFADRPVSAITSPQPVVAATPTVPLAVPSTWAGVDANRSFLQAVFGVSAEDATAEWEANELSMANEVMAKLPPEFRRATKGLRRVKSGSSRDVAGYVEMNVAPIIYMTDRGTDYKVFPGYLVHEMTHCWQMAHEDLMDKWEDRFWSGVLFFKSPKTPPVSKYGHVNPKEDMAEAVRVYFEKGAAMAAQHPERYTFIKEQIMNGVEFPAVPARGY